MPCIIKYGLAENISTTPSTTIVRIFSKKICEYIYSVLIPKCFTFYRLLVVRISVGLHFHLFS